MSMPVILRIKNKILVEIGCESNLTMGKRRKTETKWYFEHENFEWRLTNN